MPLEAPDLDTRTYADLVSELRRRITRYAPEWTDLNESDPGMTLVELFAWLTETMLYQLNRVPERNYLKFLELLDLELRPALPASADLVFTPRLGAGVEPVPAGARISAPPAAGGNPLIFETERGLGVAPVPLTDVQVFDGSIFTVKTDEDARPGLAYAPLGSPPRLGSALYLGFTPPEGGAPASFPEELRFRVFRPEATDRELSQRCDPSAAPPPPPVRLAWEYLPRDQAPWRRLDVFLDESAAFTREGYISIRGPREIEPAPQGKVDEARLWLRVRLAAGSYPAGVTPQIDFIRVNVVAAKNLATVLDELVAVSDGRPKQRYQLRRRPVEEGTLVLEVDEPAGPAADEGDRVWKRVDDFLSSGPDDRHYTLNRNTGEVRFGDGVRGRIPLADRDIVARSYRYGGGRAGNVAAEQISTPVTTLVGVESVANPRPAVGGQDEEPLDDLKLRAPGVLRRRSAAITAPDFAALAAEVGGVQRATAVPLAHPGYPQVEVPGAVTVVIVPEAADTAPQPSSDLSRAVCGHLDEHRLLTTEVHVSGPLYLKITLEARVAAAPYAAPDEVEHGILERLRGALDPRGRDFGLDLHPTSLYGVILGDGTAGVMSVDALEIWVDNQPHDLRQPVVVPAGGLVVLTDADITVTPAVDR